MSNFVLSLWQMVFDWPLGTIIAILLVGTVVLLALLAIYLFIDGIDYLTGTSESNECIVVKRTFTEEHTTVIMVGKVIIPQYIDNNWELTLECNGAQGTISVTRKYYNWVRVGSKVRADFVRGGLIGALYIRKLY